MSDKYLIKFQELYLLLKVQFPDETQHVHLLDGLVGQSLSLCHNFLRAGSYTSMLVPEHSLTLTHLTLSFLPHVPIVSFKVRHNCSTTIDRNRRSFSLYQFLHPIS